MCVCVYGGGGGGVRGFKCMFVSNIWVILQIELMPSSLWEFFQK